MKSTDQPQTKKEEAGGGGSTEWVCPPLRGRVKTLMETSATGSRTAKGYHCIEIKQGRKWTLLGNEKGLYKFDSAEARDAKIREIQGEKDEAPKSLQK
jgi:hypothetical protein